MSQREHTTNDLRPYAARLRALSRDGRAPSMARWNANRPRSLRAATTLQHQYGTWAAFVEACGLTPNPQHGGAPAKEPRTLGLCECGSGARVAHRVRVAQLSASGVETTVVIGMCEECYRIEMEMRETA